MFVKTMEGPQKTPSSKGNAFIDADIVLNLALVADGDIRTNDDILADVAVLADS